MDQTNTPALDFYKEATGKLPGVTATDASGSGLDFANLISRLLGVVMVLAALLLLLYLIWGAIEWISSGGDKSKVEKARNRITQSVIGMIVLAASLALFMTVQAFIGINVFNFTSTKTNSTQVKSQRTGGPVSP